MGYDFELLDGDDNGDGTQGRTRTRIHCSACENDCILTAGNGGLSVEWATRRFKNKGWALGKSRDLDLCPDCLKFAGSAKAAKARRAVGQGLDAMRNGVSARAAAASIGYQDLSVKQLGIVANTLDFNKLNARIAPTPTETKEMTNIVAIVAAEPPKMGRDERRLVFEKLNEHYVSETVGYSDGWSDKRIAEELGCPRKWIEDVRDEMFGPVRVSSETRNFVDRIASLDQKIFEARAQMTAAEKTFADIAAAMKTAEGAFKATLGEFEALKKLAKQLEKLY
jgi:hypothetical protein